MKLSYFLIAIYLYGRTTYIVIIAEPVRTRGSGSTTLDITDINPPPFRQEQKPPNELKNNEMLTRESQS